MKKLFVFFLLQANLQTGFSQDTLIKSDLSQLVVKVIEISSSEIKYKKINFQDGPVYSEPKSAIATVYFSNHFHENISENKPCPVFNQNKIVRKPKGQLIYIDKKLNEKKLFSLLLEKNNTQINELVRSAKKAKKRQYLGFLAFPIGLLSLSSIALAGSEDNGLRNDHINLNLVGASILFAAATVPLPLISDRNKRKRKEDTRKAIKLFNE